jgi:hypothetical protein
MLALPDRSDPICGLRTADDGLLKQYEEQKLAGDPLSILSPL